MDQIEERRIPDDEFRQDAEAGTFDGHASAFRYVDSYGTAFLKGAFRKTINDHALDGGGSRIPAVFFHDPEKMVGPISHLKEDAKGLKYTARAVDDGQTGSMVLAHLRGGTPLGMSFAFRRIDDRAAEPTDNVDMSTAPSNDMKLKDVRVITQVSLREITVLPWTFASQPMAQITDIRAKDIPLLLDAIRTGTVTDEQAGLLDQLVTLWRDRAAADSGHSTPAEVTHRNYNAEYELLRMELGVAA